MSTVDRGLLPPELRGLRTFKVYQSDGQPLRPAVDSDSRKAYYKALNRLSKTVADLLESMGREDPRHHDTPLPQRSGLAVYVAETTAELEGARAGLCDDAEKSARNENRYQEDAGRLSRNRWFESCSLQQRVERTTIA